MSKEYPKVLRINVSVQRFPVKVRSVGTAAVTGFTHLYIAFEPQRPQRKFSRR